MFGSSLRYGPGFSRLITGFSCLGAFIICISGSLTVFADDTVIYNSCKKDLQLSDSGCQCVLNEVHNTLTPNQLEVFVAMIQGDNSAMIAAQSSGKLTGEDMTTLANFMTTTPNKCKAQ